MAIATAVEILATIRDNASAMYISRVPVATKTNLAQVGDAITSDSNLMNEYVPALIQKIGESNVKSRLYTNPLARLKGQGIPMGNTIEEIFVNPAIDSGQLADQTLLLKQSKPDGKVCYYGMNRKGVYAITINEVEVKRAFNTEETYMSFYNAQVISMYSGDAIDEFILTKNVIGKAIDEGGMLVLDADLTAPKEFAKSLSNVSKTFTFPNTVYSGYNRVNADLITAGEKACLTFCYPENQCLIIRADAETEIDYEAMANYFHIPEDMLARMTILVDEIPSTLYDVYAVLCDVDSIQMRDYVFRIKSQDIGSALEFNFWLHHQQTIYLSMFGNACAFGKLKVI